MDKKEKFRRGGRECNEHMYVVQFFCAAPREKGHGCCGESAYEQGWQETFRVETEKVLSSSGEPSVWQKSIGFAPVSGPNLQVLRGEDTCGRLLHARHDPRDSGAAAAWCCGSGVWLRQHQA